MDLIDKAKKKIEDYVKNKKTSKKEKDLLKQYQDELFLAQSSYLDLDTFDDREKLYIGTHGVDNNVNDDRTKANARSKANNVVNIIYEMIESQIDTQIPQPTVNSKWRGKEYLEKMIEDSIKNDMADSEIYRINDENERITPIQGFSIITVDWNPDIDKHLYRGEIHLDNKHPKTLIPQPGVYDIENMDYFFLLSSVTPGYIKKRYGIEVENEGEQFPEYNSIDGESDNNGNAAELITLITRFGKDENNIISKFCWINDTVIEYYDDYYARYVTRCAYCYTPLAENIDEEKPCPVCLEYGREEFERVENIEDEEELLQDYQKQDGTIIPAGTVIKYFKPTQYPIIIRKNVPLPFNFGGQSDIDIIRDQADAIKKVMTTVEEKILRGGVIIKADDTHRIKTTGKLYEIIKGNPQQLNALQTMNIEGNIQQDLQFFQEQYRAAKDTLGITDSFQGKPDTTAKSGVAKQIQVFQSSGRMMSKQFNKKRSFKDLFRLMFEFKLAFYDEVRPYIQLDNTGQPVHGEFSKYEFLEQDSNGEWFYNTDFIFSAEAGDGIPKDKVWLMNQTLLYAQQGLLDKVQFWSALEKFGYPSASDFKDAAIQEKQMIQQQQQMMAEQQSNMMQQQMMMEQEDKDYAKKLDAAKLAQDNIKIEQQGEKQSQNNNKK